VGVIGKADVEIGGSNMRKRCRKCNTLKSLAEYYKNCKGKDGHLNHCKNCQNKLTRGISRRWLKNAAKYIKDKYGFGYTAVYRNGGTKNVIAILKRADFKCEECKTEKDLTVHHRDRNGRNNLNKGEKANNSINNLQILCRSCHGKLHSIEYWKDKGRAS